MRESHISIPSSSILMKTVHYTPHKKHCKSAIATDSRMEFSRLSAPSMVAHLGSVWMQSIFKVLGEYHSCRKYYGFNSL